MTQKRSTFTYLVTFFENVQPLERYQFRLLLFALMFCMKKKKKKYGVAQQNCDSLWYASIFFRWISPTLLHYALDCASLTVRFYSMVSSLSEKAANWLRFTPLVTQLQINFKWLFFLLNILFFTLNYWSRVHEHIYLLLK